MRDTSNEIEHIQARIISQMTPQQRFQSGIQMIEDGFQILENRLRQQMPNSSYASRQIQRFKELYQDELSPEEFELCLKGLTKYWQRQTE